MRNCFGLLLLAGFVAGCSTDPEGEILVGQWGNEGLGLKATFSAVTVSMPCGSGTVQQPLRLEEDGRFEFEVAIHQFYGDQELQVTGKLLTGRYLQVVISTEYSRPGSPPVLLVEGQLPDFSEFLCLGASP